MNYKEYLDYLDTLKDVARLPYTTKVENPPDMNWEYRRPFTEEEWKKELEYTP